MACKTMQLRFLKLGTVLTYAFEHNLIWICIPYELCIMSVCLFKKRFYYVCRCTLYLLCVERVCMLSLHILFLFFELYNYWLWLCSHGLESRSERCFGSRSKTWLRSWFELRAFTCIANAFPITIRICALRGNILLLLRSPRWLTHAWLQRAFSNCTRTNHVPKELCVHMS